MSKKWESAAVNTLSDLTRLVNHNCLIIDKRLNKLSQRGRKLTIFAAAAVGYSIWSELERRKQEEQIYRLTVRVKKLERGEGE